MYNTSMIQKVESYADLLKNNRSNMKVDGFDFDVNTFENLIDYFVPKDNIHVILQCTDADLDRFCAEVYHLNFAQTYRVLSGITDAYMRGAIKNLAISGNATALGIAKEHFMNLHDEQQKSAISVKIVNDLEEDN